MVIDWQAAKEAWIAAMLNELAPRLLKDARFPSAAVSVGRFEKSVTRWRQNRDIRQIINDGNELAAAAAILENMEPCETLSYEPRLAGTPKTIDFLVTGADGTRRWIDMKSVAPVWKDDDEAWQKVVKVAGEFPGNATLIVDRQWSGAAIGSQFINARLSFLQRAVDLEKKIALLTPQEQGEVRLLLCSNGSWHEDDLEDFADFYRMGQFRSDDWSRNAVKHYMTDKQITLAGTIKGFVFMERMHDEIFARKFRMNVTGPRF
jgi:hypothetical protein